MITANVALGKSTNSEGEKEVQTCVCVCASSPVRRPALDRFVGQVQMGSSSNKAFQIRTQFESADFML